MALLNKERVLFHTISLGVFFFILFFQPFPHDTFDFYYRLLFKFGFGVIIFMIMLLVRILYPCLIEKISENENEITQFSYVSGFAIWVLSSIAFICYLKYVGFIGISAHIVLKVVIICAVPPVVLLISDRMRKLRMRNKSLILENETKKRNEDYRNLFIDFKSGMNGNKLTLLIAEILFIKSANNYVEIFYLEEDQIKKKLVRNTLTNIELQIESYPTFVRCHRTCIVNTNYIEKINGNCNNRTLTIRGYKKQIQVSRRYYLTVKEAV